MKQAEEEARSLVQEAKAKARDQADLAAKEAEEKYQSIYKGAQEEAKNLVQQAEAEGEELSLPLANTGAEVSQRITGIKDSDLKDVVRIIVERIVN